MRLVTYSWLAVVLAIACAAISWLGLAGWMAVAVLLASVAMHVAGNAIGTRLREATDRDLSDRRDSADNRSHDFLAALPAMPQPSPTQLQRHSSLGRLVPVSAGIGAACGGTAGALSLLWLTASSPAGALLGGGSSAVVGGLLGFLGASFFEVVRASLRESLAAERAAAPPTPGPTAPVTRRP
jgi:hypothetical protein